jgi:hypothetical protein
MEALHSRLRRIFDPEERPLKNTPALSFPRKRESEKILKGLDSRFRRNDDLPGFGIN